MLNSITAAEEQDRAIAAVVQRAAYKALSGVMQHPAVGKIGDAAKLLGLWPVLRDARQTCTPSALKARVACIEALLLLLQERLASQFGNPAVRQEFLNCLQTVLPEVMMHLRDPGTAVREAARSCLHVAATTALHQDMQVEVVTLVSAGLAGLTQHSKAAAVDALSRLMFEHSTLIAEETQLRLITVVLLLLEDLEPKVWRSACKFAKVVVYVCSKEQTEKVLPQILRLFSSRHLASAKMLVRSIITRLVKVLPQDFLSEAFPKAHLPLLHYVQRQVARTGRPKAAKEAKANSWERFSADDGTGAVEDEDTADAQEVGRSSKRKKRARAGGDNDEDEGMGKSGDSQIVREPPTSAVMAHEAVQELLDAWEAESDNEGGDRMADARPGRKGKRKRDSAEAGTWIHEDQNIPLDFMSADAAHSVLTVRPPQQKRQRAQQVGSAGAENRADALRRSGLRFSDDGRLVVDEEVAERTGETGAEGGEGGKLFNVGTHSKKKLSPLQLLAEQRKRRVAAKALARMARKTHVVRGLDSYKPSKKKAQGDIKRKGTALQPYAYVRLNPKVVKEKHKDKSTASLSRVIKGAKQGVLKGLKARNRDQKARQLAEARRQKRRQGKRPSKPNAR